MEFCTQKANCEECYLGSLCELNKARETAVKQMEEYLRASCENFLSDHCSGDLECDKCTLYRIYDKGWRPVDQIAEEIINDILEWRVQGDWLVKLKEKYHYKDKLNQKQFYNIYCKTCGSQRCEGIDTPWFDGCKHKDELKKE